MQSIFLNYRTPQGYLVVTPRHEPLSLWEVIQADYDLAEMIAEHDSHDVYSDNWARTV